MRTNKVVLITGGTSGIGYAVAELLLARGDSVAVTGRSAERLEACADRLGRPPALLTLAGDAGDPATVASWVDATVTRFRRLDGAVANAGFVTPGGLSAGDPAQWPAMVLTNVLGPALLIHHAAPKLRPSAGRIVLIGSAAGLAPTAGNLYGATKYAVTGLAENARRMLTDQGVGVSLVSPGRVATAFWDEVGGVPELPNLDPVRVAEAVAYVLDRPDGVNVDAIAIRPPRSPV